MSSIRPHRRPKTLRAARRRLHRHAPPGRPLAATADVRGESPWGDEIVGAAALELLLFREEEKAPTEPASSTT